MPLPIFILNNHCISAGAMVGALTSPIIDIAEVPGYCVQAIYTGSPVGTLTLSGSNDGVTFTSITTQAVSAAGSWLNNVASAHYRYVKVGYTPTSGTGVLDVYVSAKQI